MWSDHPFSQNKTRNKAAKRAVGSRVGSDRKGGRGWTKLEKKGGVGNIGGLHKLGGLGPLCQLYKLNTQKTFHST